jgi:hypothetical protein
MDVREALADVWSRNGDGTKSDRVNNPGVVLHKQWLSAASAAFLAKLDAATPTQPEQEKHILELNADLAESQADYVRALTLAGERANEITRLTAELAEARKPGRVLTDDELAHWWRENIDGSGRLSSTNGIKIARWAIKQSRGAATGRVLTDSELRSKIHEMYDIGIRGNAAFIYLARWAIAESNAAGGQSRELPESSPAESAKADGPPAADYDAELWELWRREHPAAERYGAMTVLRHQRAMWRDRATKAEAGLAVERETAINYLKKWNNAKARLAEKPVGPTWVEIMRYAEALDLRGTSAVDDERDGQAWLDTQIVRRTEAEKPVGPTGAEIYEQLVWHCKPKWEFENWFTKHVVSRESVEKPLRDEIVEMGRVIQSHVEANTQLREEIHQLREQLKVPNAARDIANEANGIIAAKDKRIAELEARYTKLVNCINGIVADACQERCKAEKGKNNE